MLSTQKRNGLSRLLYLVCASLMVMLRSGSGWSGRMVLFCRLTITQSRICSAGSCNDSATVFVKSPTVLALRIRYVCGAAEVLESFCQSIRSNPWYALKLSSVTTLMGRYRCASSRSFCRFSRAARSSLSCFASDTVRVRLQDI